MGRGSGGGGSGGGSSGAPSEQAVKDQIKEKPFALIDIPCEIIEAWVATATKEVQQAQINKLNQIVNTTTTRPGITTTTVARLQDINDAHSTVVNMYYFPVTVTQLPIIDGVRQTPEQFLEYIRKNINNFVNTNYAEFEPYQWCGMDEPALWNSSNPIGAVIGIDIGVQIMVRLLSLITVVQDGFFLRSLIQNMDSTLLADIGILDLQQMQTARIHFIQEVWID